MSVSRTPGHTKYFQTYYLTQTVKLCDCPGLVFPSRVNKQLQVQAHFCVLESRCDFELTCLFRLNRNLIVLNITLAHLWEGGLLILYIPTCYLSKALDEFKGCFV